VNTTLPQPADVGAMSASVVVLSSALADLKKPRVTPRKIPGLAKSEQRGFIVSDRALVGGNLCARDMLGDLRYWLEPDETGKNRAGKEWVARSIQFWMKQLGYSKQEVRTGIKALEASGAVIRKQEQFGNWDTDHYQLVLSVAGRKLNGGGCVAGNTDAPAGVEEVTSKCVATNTPHVASNTATSGSTHEVPNHKNPNTKNAPTEPAAQGKPTAPVTSAGKKGTPKPFPFIKTEKKWKEADKQTVLTCIVEWARMKAEFIQLHLQAAKEEAAKPNHNPKDVAMFRAWAESVTSIANPVEQDLIRKLAGYVLANGLTPTKFFVWLTPQVHQKIGLELWDDPRPNMLYVLDHRDAFIAAYRKSLPIQGKDAHPA